MLGVEHRDRNSRMRRDSMMPSRLVVKTEDIFRRKQCFRMAFEFCVTVANWQ